MILTLIIIILLINLVFNFIFLLYKYLFNGKLIEPEESIYYNIYNSYGLNIIFLKLLENRLELNLNFKLKNFKKHEWILFLDMCYSLVPKETSIFNKKTLNIVILDSIASYRGWCHFRGLPTRGQRTWTNAWSAYKSNGILRNFKLKNFKKYYGNVPEKEVTVAYVAEQLNFIWRFQWDREWFSAKNELLKFEGHPKTMKIDLYSMYNYQVIHPFKLNKMSKKQKQSFKKNYFSLGFDVGFTKILLNERYKVDNDGEIKSNVSGASIITRDERLNKKKKIKLKMFQKNLLLEVKQLKNLFEIKIFFIWFLYKRILINTQKLNFNLHNIYNLFKINFFFNIYLNKLIFSNFYKNKKFFILIFNKKYFYKFNWMKKNKRLYSVKFNFNFFKKKKKLKNIKRMNINKILKTKRITGLFKRKFNMRTTILKKRSLIFFFLENKKKKKHKRKYFFRNRYFYKITNINLFSRVKSIISENRKILSFFLKKKNLKRQNKFNKYVINYLNKKPKNIINLFEYRLTNILIKSHFFNNNNDSDFFIKNGFITVNNNVCRNVNENLNFGDVIKLNAKFNYYFFYRKSLNKSLKMSKKINWAFYKFIKKNKRNKYFPKVYKWINSSRYFGFDIPNNLEVDFINMTIVILIKHLDINKIEISNIKYINFYLTRLYNWNYIV